jgi:hypothetical protein
MGERMLSNDIAKITAILMLSGALIGCAQIETSPPSQAMGPATKVVHPVGTSIVVDDRGERTTWEKTADTSQGSVWTGSNGCTYTATNDNPFAPSVKFEGCSGNTGTQTIQTKSGEIFPLQVGKTVSWKITGQHTRDSWETTRRCEVVETVSLTVPAGTYDAFHVVCRDSWNTHTFFYAPEIGANVAYLRMHKKRGVQRDQKLVQAPTRPAS